MKLDAAVLSDGGNSSGEAACEARKHNLDGRRRVVLRGKHLRMVGLYGERFLARLLGAQPEEVPDCRAAVRSVDPFTACTPLESGRGWGLGKCLAGTQQGSDVDTVICGLA